MTRASDLPDLSDDALMRRVGGSDFGALGILFERHQQRTFALCYRITRDAEAASDLVQETFLRLLRYRDGFRGDAAFTTYLYRLACNVCRDHLQRASREHTIHAAAANADVHTRAHDARADVDERHAMLEVALARLAPDDRAVLVLRRYDDLPYEEIARVLDCTPGAAGGRAHRALNELREIYNDLRHQQLS